MNRDQGLKRTAAITGALIAASLVGTLAVGIAAHAGDQATSTDSNSTTSSDSSSTTDSSSRSSTATSPQLSTGSDNSGQATSGGS